MIGIGHFAQKIFKKGKWKLESVESSERLDKMNYPEIIIQNTKKYIDHPSRKGDIVGDGMISAHAALATELVEKEWKNKEFIGVHTRHVLDYSVEEEKRIEDAILRKLNEPMGSESFIVDSSTLTTDTSESLGCVQIP